MEELDARWLVREAVRKTGLLADGRPVVAMLSGGRDSVCLLDLAVSLCGPGHVRALHVNYRLREEADGDEAHCLTLCERLGVALRVLRADPSSRPTSGNLHAWARELRYRAAGEMAGEGEALIATGHTSSDQAETILYRLASSPGRRALLGMAPREGRLIRPLLAVSREQTASYCRAAGLPWREDPSNDDPRYARSRVRHGLLEALREVHPGAERNVVRTAELLREESELLNGLLERELDGRDEVPVAILGRLPRGLSRMIVIHLAEVAAGAYVPQAGDRIDEILSLGRRGGRAELHVGGGVGAVIDGGLLSMVLLAPRHHRSGPSADGGSGRSADGGSGSSADGGSGPSADGGSGPSADGAGGPSAGGGGWTITDGGGRTTTD